MCNRKMRFQNVFYALSKTYHIGQISILTILALNLKMSIMRKTKYV